MGYGYSPAWFDDAERADAAWHMLHYWRTATEGARPDVVHVIAEADTGSRYSVVVTPMGDGAIYEGGGDVLVTLISPYRTCYVMQSVDDLHYSYVAEKFLPIGCHAGDLVAVTRTIALALHRDAVLPKRPADMERTEHGSV